MTRAEKGARLGIYPPTPATLKKYGLTASEWLAFVERQGWQCPICEKRPRLWNVDHEHVPGWKIKPPKERRRFVRGVLCAYCNYRLVHSNITAAESGRVTAYLVAYEERRDG